MGVGEGREVEGRGGDGRGEGPPTAPSDPRFHNPHLFSLPRLPPNSPVPSPSRLSSAASPTLPDEPRPSILFFDS